jgi:dienelactone hydrolase
MRYSIIGLALLALGACGAAEGEEEGTETGMEIHTEVVAYRHGETELEGYAAWPATGEGKLPGVVVVHAWKGIGDHERESVERLARSGKVAFALDMYGKGIRPETNDEARKQATIYRSDRALMRARAGAGLAWLKAHPRVDPARTGAIGYCFGGGTVLEMARGGADVAAVVSFHGNLDTPDPTDARNIRAKVLVLHGSADASVPMTDVVAFAKEMDDAKVDWHLVVYGGAVHGFTHAGDRHDEKADRRSWKAMEALFDEVF